MNNLGNVTLSPEGFQFLLQSAEGGDPITLTTDATGKATISMAFAKGHIGKTYTYQLSQVAGDKEHVTYSDATHTVTITIVQDMATNKLAAKLTVDGKVTDALVVKFENTYDYSEPTAPQQESDDSMLWIIVGVSCGAVLFLAAVTVIVLQVKKRRNSR